MRLCAGMSRIDRLIDGPHKCLGLPCSGCGRNNGVTCQWCVLLQVSDVGRVSSAVGAFFHERVKPKHTCNRFLYKSYCLTQIATNSAFAAHQLMHASLTVRSDSSAAGNAHRVKYNSLIYINVRLASISMLT